MNILRIFSSTVLLILGFAIFVTAAFLALHVAIIIFGFVLAMIAYINLRLYITKTKFKKRKDDPSIWS